MAEKKSKFSFKKLFFMKSFFGSLVWKIELTDKPLNWLSIIFLVAFDIFIFINLVDWLNNQRDNIASPYEKYTYDCKALFNEKDDFDTNEFDIIYSDRNNIITKNINAPFYSEDFENDEASEYCKYLGRETTKIKNNSNFKSLYKQIISLKKEISNLESKKSNYERDYKEFREDYKAWLWDYNYRISSVASDSIRADYERILRNIESIKSKIESLEVEINNIKEVIVLKWYIDSNREVFKKEESNYRFWYPVYVTWMEAILILPILIFTIFLYNFSLKRRFRVLSILASNLALISWLFAFFILIKVIYWILPKKFFANLITYLASIKALAIWNYLLTIFGIILFWFLMFSSQKAMEKYKKIKAEQAKQRDLLNKERIWKERYWNKACIECNTKLLEGATYCSNCWVDQYKECKKCKNAMPKAYTHCEKCWTKN